MTTAPPAYRAIHSSILPIERKREYRLMKHTPPSNRLDAILDRIAAKPFIKKTARIFSQIEQTPIGIRMAFFAILWGLAAIATRPFSFVGAERILETYANATYWSYGVFITGCIHLYSAKAKRLTLYILASIVQCVIWWTVFTAFIMGGVPSAGVMTYGLIAVSTTIALVRFDEGIR